MNTAYLKRPSSGRKKRLARLTRLLEHVSKQLLPPIHRGNQVTFLADGPAFFGAFLNSIRSAKTFVLMEYYLIRDDVTGSSVANELIAAVERGVRVLLIYDYIGCIDTPSSFFKKLELQGVELVPFNVPSFRRGIRWFDRRDHRKMLIVDGHSAFLGGLNIGDEYSGIKARPDHFRDLGLSVHGNAVRELISIFSETWQMQKEQPPELPAVDPAYHANHETGKADISFVSGGPHQRSSYIRQAFLLNIASASENLLIVSPYFVPGPRIIRSLLRAARRGVRVRLLLPARSDVWIVLLVGRSSYETLLRGGIEVYELEDDILHAKVMLVDTERTIIGSANLDQRSFHRNFEINAVIDSSTFTQQIRHTFERELVSASRITLANHEQRDVLTRVLEKLINLFGWFL